MRAVSSHEGTCRCNVSLGHVPATFSCVCKCYDFVPATCPRYTSLLHVASVCTKQVFVAATCRCDISLRHDPSCLRTLRRIRCILSKKVQDTTIIIYEVCSSLCKGPQEREPIITAGAEKLSLKTGFKTNERLK